ncbi:MAG: hypothetical protein ABJO27_09960 [Pseudoruegeria sp.]
MIYLIRTALFSAILCSIPMLANAQSWRTNGNGAIAPASISGDPAHGAEVTCHNGNWVMFLQSFDDPTVETMPVELRVDSQRFQGVFALFEHGSEGVELDTKTIVALKSGSRLSISYTDFYGHKNYNHAFALRGSSRALSSAAENCKYPTPATATSRFKSATAEQSPDAAQLAKVLLASEIADAKKRDAKVGLENANFVDLDSGWRFLLADIGTSTSLFGIMGFYTVVIAKPPSQDWQIVDRQAGVATYIDNMGNTSGYPNIIYQSLRGLNPPYNLWAWDGMKYTHQRKIAQ